MDGKKIGAIIQTRMSSTRLPGKVMLDLCGKPVIRHVIERLRQSKLLDEIIIATTQQPADDQIEQAALSYGVKCFRGSENDVLARYYGAADCYGLDVIVRITSDCPLIDPFVVDDVLKAFIEGNYDIAANVHPDPAFRTFPRGLDTEIFTRRMLDEAFHKADKTYQREHVAPYIYEHAPKVLYYKNDVNYSRYRWTLDTQEDWILIRSIYEYLYRGKHDFYLMDVIRLCEEHPELAEINRHVEQKKTIV